MTSYADGVGIGQINAILKSHDKNMAALCVSCGESKIKFHSLRSKMKKYLYAEYLPANALRRISTADYEVLSENGRIVPNVVTGHLIYFYIECTLDV